MRDSTAVIILVTVVLILLLVKLAWHWAENKYLFYPIKQYLPATSMAEPVPQYEYVQLPNGVTGWYFKQFPGRPTVLYCHGNAANVSYWHHMIRLILSQQLNLLIFDYRGFGQSPGNATIDSFIEDAEEAYQYLRRNGVPSSRIIVWGESMGGMAAINIARKHCIAYLALAATFTEPSDILEYWGYRHHLYQLPTKLLHRLNNSYALEGVTVPVIIIHSSEDDVIPYSCAEKLYQQFRGCKQLIRIKGSHAAPDISLSQLQQICDFCQITGYCDSKAERHLQDICRDVTKICPF